MALRRFIAVHGFGQRDRASERRFLQSDSCTNTCFQPVLGFFDRPELRFAVSYVDWSEDLNGYPISTDADAATMGEGGEVLFALQMETVPIVDISFR